jgi:hypothetical protein
MEKTSQQMFKGASKLERIDRLQRTSDRREKDRLKAANEEEKRRRIENLYLEEWKMVSESQQEELRMKQQREKSRKEELRKLERELQQKLHAQIDQLRARLASDQNRTRFLRSAAKRAFASQIKTAAHSAPFHKPSEYADETDNGEYPGFVF